MEYDPGYISLIAKGFKIALFLFYEYNFLFSDL